MSSPLMSENRHSDTMDSERNCKGLGGQRELLAWLGWGFGGGMEGSVGTEYQELWVRLGVKGDWGSEGAVGKFPLWDSGNKSN